MNNVSLLQAIRGPVLLITVGVLFTVDHFGQYGFGSTWPLLIIVFGVLKLAERATGPSAAEPPGAGVGGNQS
jgi:hypothetical protein